MPKFILNTPPRRKPPHAFYGLSEFSKAYVEALFFTNGDTGDDNENLLNDLGVEKLTRDAVANIARDCEAFLSTIMPDGCFAQQWLARAAEQFDYSDEQAGHDFWFSRQGHGVGFWDRGLGELGEGLHKAARGRGEAYCETYRGWIYHR
jgi:hypothetical protein